MSLDTTNAKGALTGERYIESLRDGREVWLDGERVEDVTKHPAFTGAIRQQIASAVDLIVQVARLSDGSRRVISITEVTGMEGEIISMQDIFVFKKRGIGPNGEVLGDFMATGIRPKFAERLIVSGIQLPMNLFESRGTH